CQSTLITHACAWSLETPYSFVDPSPGRLQNPTVSQTHQPRQSHPSRTSSHFCCGKFLRVIQDTFGLLPPGSRPRIPHNLFTCKENYLCPPSAVSSFLPSRSRSPARRYWHRRQRARRLTDRKSLSP